MLDFKEKADSMGMVELNMTFNAFAVLQSVCLNLIMC